MRFPLYRFVSGLLQVFAWIVLVLAIVAAILLVAVPQEWIQNVQFEWQGQAYMMTIPWNGVRWGGFFGILLGGIIGWVSILALAGVLRLLTAIEENTFRGRPTVLRSTTSCDIADVHRSARRSNPRHTTFLFRCGRCDLRQLWRTVEGSRHLLPELRQEDGRIATSVNPLFIPRITRVSGDPRDLCRKRKERGHGRGMVAGLSC
jgi:hypothetical protein